MSTDLAWLAGFWDGEGSVGLVKNKATQILVAQLSHTEYDSVTHILEILENHNISGRGYTYQERDPAKHRDAHYLRITGINNIRALARLLVPYAVTKRRHWEIAIAWADSRIKVSGGIDSKGHLKRGGNQGDKSYSVSDEKLADELREINRRGPLDRQKRKEGRINV